MLMAGDEGLRKRFSSGTNNPILNHNCILIILNLDRSVCSAFECVCCNRDVPVIGVRSERAQRKLELRQQQNSHLYK